MSASLGRPATPLAELAANTGVKRTDGLPSLAGPIDRSNQDSAVLPEPRARTAAHAHATGPDMPESPRQRTTMAEQISASKTPEA